MFFFLPGTTVVGLHTVIAHNYSVVHNIAKHSDDDAEKSQKNPILADFGERIAPYKGNDSKETRSPFAAISAQLFASLLLFFLSRLLRFTKFSRLLSGVFSKTPRVPAVHLIVFHASLTSVRERKKEKITRLVQRFIVISSSIHFGEGRIFTRLRATRRLERDNIFKCRSSSSRGGGVNYRVQHHENAFPRIL